MYICSYKTKVNEHKIMRTKHSMQDMIFCTVKSISDETVKQDEWFEFWQWHWKTNYSLNELTVQPCVAERWNEMLTWDVQQITDHRTQADACGVRWGPTKLGLKRWRTQPSCYGKSAYQRSCNQSDLSISVHGSLISEQNIKSKFMRADDDCLMTNDRTGPLKVIHRLLMMT